MASLDRVDELFKMLGTISPLEIRAHVLPEKAAKAVKRLQDDAGSETEMYDILTEAVGVAIHSAHLMPEALVDLMLAYANLILEHATTGTNEELAEQADLARLMRADYQILSAYKAFHEVACRASSVFDADCASDEKVGE